MWRIPGGKWREQALTTGVAAEGGEARRAGAPNCGVQPQLLAGVQPAQDPRRSAAACDVQEQHHSGVQPELKRPEACTGIRKRSAVDEKKGDC